MDARVSIFAIRSCFQTMRWSCQMPHAAQTTIATIVKMVGIDRGFCKNSVVMVPKTGSVPPQNHPGPPVNSPEGRTDDLL
jgi:hypothetical protein